MEESIDRIISENAFEQLKRLLEELAACDAKMQGFIKTVDALRRGLENASGLKDVSAQYERLTQATEQLNDVVKRKTEVEKQAAKECDRLAIYVAKETDGMKDNAKAQETRRTKMQQLVDAMMDQQRELEAVNQQLKDAKQQYDDGGRSSDELKNRISDLTIEQASLRESVAASTKEFRNMLAESQNEETSLKAKAAALSQLKQQYDLLSESERGNVNIGGEMKARMGELEAQLKAAKTSIGSFSVKVGDTEINVGRLKTELRNMLESIQAQTFAFQELEVAIAKQEDRVRVSAQLHGTSSDEYRAEVSQLEALRNAHQQTGKKIEEMRQKAGQLKDIIADTSDAVKAWSSDTANIDAVVTGVDTMVQGYTALKATMTALGIESEELVNVFAKIQILQQGVNAVQKIADNLTKESIFKTKMKAVIEKMRLAMTEAQTKATMRETASQSANTAAITANTAARKGNSTALAAGTASTTGAIVATGGLATAQTAATATSFTLVGALKAVGVAIKSIPVVGWIIAAVAALTALGKLVYDMLTAEKELTDEQKIRNELLQKEKDIRMAATETVEKEKAVLSMHISRMKELKEGTDGWKDAVKKAAEMLGVSNDWLKDNKDRVDELADAWYRCKLQQTLADKYAEESGNAAIEAEKQILAVQGEIKARNEAIDAIKQLSEEDRKRWKKAEHLVRSGNETEKAEAARTIETMKKKTRAYAAEVSKVFAQKAKEAANAAVQYSVELDKAKKESNKEEKAKTAGKDAAKERVKFIEETNKRIAELEAKSDREVMELRLKNLDRQCAEELKKYAGNAQARVAIERKYALERAAVEEEYAQKRNERVMAANKEAANILLALNEKRLADSDVTEQQLTEILVGNERARNERILEENQRLFLKEVENLEKGSAEYLAVKAKWDAKNEQQAYESAEREMAIRKKGFDSIIASIKRQVKDEENRITITVATDFSANADGKEELLQVKIDGIQMEIDKYRELADTYRELGMTEEEYTSKMLELNAQLAVAQKEQHDNTMAQLQAQKQAREALAFTITDSMAAIGYALAEGIEDERQKVIVQQSLAMAQVLMEQAVAIAKAVSSASAGDPYTLAIRIAAAVGAVATSFIAARNAIKQAEQSVSQASAYAEGTDYHKGGAAVIGEEYKPELVIAGGKSFVVDQPTFFENLPVGSKVIPLESAGRMAVMEQGMGLDLSDVVGGLSRIEKRPLVRIDVGENVYAHIVRGASQARILNSQFAH